MGVVYMALDTELNRWVALKLVRPLASEGDEAAGGATTTSPEDAAPPPAGTVEADCFEELQVRFLQEAWITGGLEHPGIVPIYELGETSSGVPFYTMRLVPGARTLQDAIDEVRGAPIEARLALFEPFLKLCDTVRYAHDQGVIHRDLKPANVALGDYGETVLLDWGLAKLDGRDDVARSSWQEKIHAFRDLTDAETQAGALGTPGYMSPEAALGRIEAVDARSDVYSLGAILFEILTGRLPYLFQGYMQLATQIASEDAPEASTLDPTVPRALSDLCARVLSRDPAERPQRAEELADLIRRWQAESTLDRELEGHVRSAQDLILAAGESEGLERLAYVDRAAATLAQVESKRPGDGRAAELGAQVQRLREEGMRERERASGRRLLKRVGVAVIAATAIAAVLVGIQLDTRRRQAEDAEGRANVALKAESAALDAKSSALERVLRLSDSKKVRDLSDEVDRLWPVHPAEAGRMAAWMRRAEAVLANRSDHEAALATLRERARPDTGAERGTPLQFESADDDWLHATLADLLGGLTALSDPGNHEVGALALVSARHAEAAALRERSVGSRTGAWEETLTLLASSPRYGGLQIHPQVGLIPLGPDPESGLFEFAHVGSGSIPERDLGTGKLILAEDAAIVLVLIPAATFVMGAQKDDQAERNHDSHARSEEAPIRDVSLDPYFIGKGEVTQAQWAALTGGETPSEYAAGQSIGGNQISVLNPVEQVSWEMCDRWLARRGLALPTEAQWEHACRAGTETPWHTGGEPATLGGTANIKDRYLKEHGGPALWSYTLEVDDGFSVHAPIASLAPNALGLHDMHGNVMEWCRDTFRETYDPNDLENPLSTGAGDRVFRGGSWYSLATQSRSAMRRRSGSTYRMNNLGVRAGRPVTVD